ncbi:hypothetical protein [Spongiactinospora sp. TRM90649]|uniref:DUF7426 family protein n=1 Tax=Spongiactinospora sp. TRM90649 TaxID=3031114 RepID=UPI0023F90EB0|nr:hypothetical protein [Spongiactinospora sp. TRM90649]MDF5756661.1 hypothetical protein [Spongiactinospora sp. TRM90649]
MATFADLDDFFDDGLELPVAGKTYRVPPPSAETGLYCQRLAEAGQAAAKGDQAPDADLDDARELDLYRRVLGPVYDELIADGVSWTRIKHVGITAFMWVIGNEQAAQAYWERGPEGVAPAATRAARSTT